MRSCISPIGLHSLVIVVSAVLAMTNFSAQLEYVICYCDSRGICTGYRGELTIAFGPAICHHDQHSTTVRSGRKQGLVSHSSRLSTATAAAAAGRLHQSGNRIGYLLPFRTSATATPAAGHHPSSPGYCGHAATAASVLRLPHYLLVLHVLVLLLAVGINRIRSSR